jgi:hypothetical protein
MPTNVVQMSPEVSGFVTFGDRVENHANAHSGQSAFLRL